VFISFGGDDSSKLHSKLKKRTLKLFFKLFSQQILLNLSTLITTFSSFLSYITVMPLMIGFSKDFLCYFHLGSIWICLLPPFLYEHSSQSGFEDGTLELYCSSSYCLQKNYFQNHRVYKIEYEN
jgi:hypothetical protein